MAENDKAQKHTAHTSDEHSKPEPSETPALGESELESEAKAQDDTQAGHQESQLPSVAPIKPKASHAFLRSKLGISSLIAGSFIVLLAVLYAIPATRYGILGMVVKKDVTVVVVDSTTGKPVTQASVVLAGKVAMSDAAGKARFNAIPVGDYTIQISKKYYATNRPAYTVPIFSNPGQPTLNLKATGRQVPVVVVNKISGQPVAKALLSAADTSVTTDDKGQATIVLPANKASVDASIKTDGYNTQQVTVTITEQQTTANTFAVVPTGKIYFLSNLSGKVDVVSTNLDGSNRQTVVAGTGHETPQTTVLLASRDWKYLALQAQRTATASPELDLIDTSNNQLTPIDQGNATFTPVGWSGDKFIYTVDRTNVNRWQNGQEALKSFDAPTRALTTLDQTTASGTDSSNYIGQEFGAEYVVSGGTVVYAMNWYANGSYFNQLYSKQAAFISIGDDGSHKTTLKTFSLASGTQSYGVDISLSAYNGPNTIAIEFSGGDKQQFYEYLNGQVTTDDDLTSEAFYNTNYPTYLVSPSGTSTFWAALTDGKNSLTVGDADAKKSTVVAPLSDYSPYGWFTDNYLLVAKNGSELYIMPAAGGTPLKISDYYKPSQIFRGYGGGYGGL